MSGLFFSAQWCSACKQAYPIIKRLMDERYQIEIIDVDAHKEIANKYSINSLPTLVILENGVEKTRMVGRIDYTELSQLLKRIPDYKIW